MDGIACCAFDGQALLLNHKHSGCTPSHPNPTFVRNLKTLRQRFYSQSFMDILTFGIIILFLVRFFKHMVWICIRLQTSRFGFSLQCGLCFALSYQIVNFMDRELALHNVGRGLNFDYAKL